MKTHFIIKIFTHIYIHIYIYVYTYTYKYTAFTDESRHTSPYRFPARQQRCSKLCNAQQHNSQQRKAIHCNTQQHSKPHCWHTADILLTHTFWVEIPWTSPTPLYVVPHSATQSNRQQHTAKRGNTRRHLATHCNTSQNNADKHLISRHILNVTNTALSSEALTNTKQDTAGHCRKLQHTATHCNSLRTNTSSAEILWTFPTPL